MALARALGLALLCRAAPAALLWVHTENISVAVDAASGAIAHVNTSVYEPTAGAARGVAWDVVGEALAGEGSARPVVLSASAAPCARGVCARAAWRVRGQTSNGSCCADYDVDVEQTFWAAGGLAGPVPAAIGWETTFVRRARRRRARRARRRALCAPAAP